MLQPFATPIVAGVVSATGLAVAASEGPDFAGIALVISAIAAVIGATTGLVTALRRRPDPPPAAEVDALAEVLRDIRDRLDEDKP